MKSNIDFKEGADLLHFSESNRIYCTSSFNYLKETQKSHPFTVLKPPRYVRLQMHLTQGEDLSRSPNDICCPDNSTQALLINSYIIDNPLICVWWEEVGLQVSYKWKVINNLQKPVTMLYIAGPSTRSVDATKHVSYPLVGRVQS